MTRQPKHTLPDYFINDLESLGWKAIPEHMEGETGCFTREHEERLLTIFARLRAPNERISSEYRFSPRLRLSTTWYNTVYGKISGDRLEYPRLEIQPELQHFFTPQYSVRFLQEASDSVIRWSVDLDLRKALLSTATIPEGTSYPNNSYSYIASHAILGNHKELEKLKFLVESNLERPLVGYVKTIHLENAIECCKDPEKYGLSTTLISYLRGTDD